ncbi:hypothetical protein PISMIDRAFT_467923 [Pisolithus microcarpus 441]|uniref:Uncharacterized protein n=1 Tax=Pisolithus microcarpus 441 TaxID=765257 RepID=A0A0C9Y4N6_9AGAM|nr:hypothetical protein PISMIDRAFT_467923 [Pisolithus microcarpus 441]
MSLRSKCLQSIIHCSFSFSSLGRHALIDLHFSHCLRQALLLLGVDFFPVQFPACRLIPPSSQSFIARTPYQIPLHLPSCLGRAPNKKLTCISIL